MWTRSELKSNAKQVLRRTYWLGFAIALVAGVLAGVSGSAGTLNSLRVQLGIDFPYTVIASVGLLSLLYGIFISAPLNVGLYDFFMSSREYDISFGRLFSAFSGGNFLNVVKILFLRSLYITLWSLLLFVPGIIKSYEYYFIPYILAENPSISKERAFQISKEMTQGDKFNIFVLQLSFIGWELLGMLACFVGTYFVTPYVMATFAELYAAKRTEALMRGIATEEELCGFHGDGM